MVNRKTMNAAAFMFGFTISTIVGLLLVPEIVRVVMDVTENIDAESPSGPWILFFVFVFMGTPLSVGYAFALLAAAVLFGWTALPIVYAGVVVGGAVTFGTVRMFQACNLCKGEFVRKYFKGYRDHITAVEDAISERPFQTVVLLQMSIIPYGILGALLPLMTEVTFFPFLAACFVTRVKIIIWIWIGLQAKTLVEARKRSESFDNEDLIPYGMTVIFSVLALVVVGRLSKSNLEKIRAARHDDEDDDESNRQTPQPVAQMVPVQHVMMYTPTGVAAQPGAVMYYVPAVPQSQLAPQYQG